MILSGIVKISVVALTGGKNLSRLVKDALGFAPSVL